VQKSPFSGFLLTKYTFRVLLHDLARLGQVHLPVPHADEQLLSEFAHTAARVSGHAGPGTIRLQEALF
jgi:hypothetical protein